MPFSLFIKQKMTFYYQKSTFSRSLKKNDKIQFIK
ncbi:hypothetical protein HD_1065 [[Haemophilus] ducreyi 35000HP]|uniref:Uncharacterized protein n=1 Tax=Haemophilus ducreyi (strain 35000HP / ATCC 700724) TaxID=233412 RepID=Q7VMC1_HAEDU|nr:hypothetical protein HD_1065 [[Haemophilus] ducreyi 35000HP]